MKKVLVTQIVLLALVILIGSMFKGNLGNDALRALHKLSGLLAGVVGITSVVFAFKDKTKPATKVLLIVAMLAIFVAGAAGKAAASGKGTYTTSFNRMRLFAVFSVLTTVGAYVGLPKPTTKKESTSTEQN